MCDDSVAHNVPLFLLSLLVIIFSFISLIFNYHFSKVLLISGGHLPRSVKFLLVSCSIAYGIKSMYLTFHGIYLLMIFFFGLSQLSVTWNTCVVVESFYGTSSLNVLFTVWMIACNRLVVTRFGNIDPLNNPTFQGYASKAYLPFMIVALWIVSIMFYTLFVTVDAPIGSKALCICYYVNVASTTGSTIRTSMVIVLEIVVIAFYLLVNKLNRKVHSDLWQEQVAHHRHNLNNRFIKWTNLKATKMLLPVSICHAIIIISVSCLFDPLKRYFAQTINTNYVSLVALRHIFMAIDALLHPVLCLKYSETLFKIFQDKYPRFSNILNCHFGSTKVVTTPGVADHTQRISAAVSKVPTGNKVIIDYRIDAKKQQETLYQAWDKQLGLRGSKMTTQL